MPSLVQWETPVEPSTPFGEGVFLFDVLRTLIIAMNVCIAFISVSLILERANTLGMKARLAGTAIAYTVFVGVREIEHFGDYAHWMLYVGFFASVVYSWGLWSFFKWELPPRLRVDRGPDV